MKEDTIITLDNNKDYALLERLVYKDHVYFFAAGVDDKEESTGEFLFIEEVKKEDKMFVKKVNDEELINKLAVIVSKDYYEAAKSLEEE